MLSAIERCCRALASAAVYMCPPHVQRAGGLESLDFDFVVCFPHNEIAGINRIATCGPEGG